MSSSSTSQPHSRWPQYGPVPMIRCPDCPRTAPLKRRVTLSDTHGNLGREYVKCDGKPELGKDLRSCNHFEWLDKYIDRIGGEGASVQFKLPSAGEKCGSAGPGSATPGALASTVGNGEEVNAAAELKELKQMNKHLRKLVGLKKQDNVMAAFFYFCVIALGFAYVLIISR